MSFNETILTNATLRSLHECLCYVQKLEVSSEIVARQSLFHKCGNLNFAVQFLTVYKFAARRLLQAHSPGRLEASRAICQHH